MTDETTSTSAHSPSLFTRNAIGVTSVLSVAGILCGYFAFSQNGNAGVGAVAIAWGISVLSSLVALFLTSLAKPNITSVNLILGAHVIRIGLSLFAVLAIHMNGGPLAKANAVFWIFGFYLLGLAMETILAVRMITKNNSTAGQI